jgi:hypothetical protein
VSSSGSLTTAAGGARQPWQPIPYGPGPGVHVIGHGTKARGDGMATLRSEIPKAYDEVRDIRATLEQWHSAGGTNPKS